MAALRYSSADSAFPAGSFSTETHPTPPGHKTQIRVTGKNTLGDGFFADYDLRYGFLYETVMSGGVRTVDASSGLQEQRVGLGYVLARRDGFSNALRLSVVTPGAPESATPSLSSGQWALEPSYAESFATGLWDLTASFEIGTRVYLDGGSAQLRTRFQISAPVGERLRLSAELTFRRSMLFGAYTSVLDKGELSNIVRPGVEAEYELSDGLAAVLAYQVYVAGMGGHADQRLTAGLALTY